jgi:integration host factor subunit beta
MVRSELLEKLQQAHPHLPRSVLEPALDTILNEIIDCLALGDRLEIRGFGRFSSRVWDARMGRNPKTGEPVPVARKRILLFRASKLLLERLNRTTSLG